MARTAFRAAVAAIVALGGAPALAGPTALVDATSGRVLSAEQPFRKWVPASLTKLMTVRLAFKALAAGELTEKSPVRMSAAAARQPPAKMGYGIGAVMTLDNALKMMIVKSANDVSVAVAEAVAGSVTAFVEQMNAEAVALGMTDTRFANPNGLDDDGQYTTARDLALLAASIRRDFPDHAPLFAIPAIRTAKETDPTYNILIGRYAGADGMKTGFVCASGFNMIASATRDGRTLIAVVLGEESQKARAETAARLLTAGFAMPADAGEPVAALADAGGDAAQPVADMRGEVCTEKARAARWDGREIEGYITFDTPDIVALKAPLPGVPVGLGGTEGQSAAAVMVSGQMVKSIPVPAPRPVREAITDDEDFSRYALRPGFSVPAPGERPQAAN
ncbi:MAG TPA: D-alanyl-D-alanine carboxypeptidase family protein [Rhizobiaceae bacterium]|nr:D-alanyl-D-alanine carboxypeptidase family protein [Rhizobiaceae bacterium]